MQLDSNSFFKEVEGKSLFAKDDLLIAAVSGGCDSIVLAHLLYSCGYRFHIAHVNFGLRGEESDGDETFVREFAESKGIEFHLKRVEKSEFEISGKGVQEAARDIRYRWFEELAEKLNARYVLLAHHQNDQSETILHQFIRGGMLSALRGMQTKNGIYLRPLLNFSREEIERYAKKNKLTWREDSSNTSDKYTRNFIRHELIPKLQNVNPRIRESLAERAASFTEMDELVSAVIHSDIEKNTFDEGDTRIVPLDFIEGYSYKRLLIWQLISEYGFSSAQIDEVFKLMSSQSGAFIDSEVYRILKDRERLLIFPKTEQTIIHETVSQLPFHSPEIALLEVSKTAVHFGDEKIQFLDLNKIEFPLLIRNPQPGDRMILLGMKETKKLSDIFIHKKLSIADKEKQLVICDSSDRIIAIPGIAVSELCKLDEGSERVMRLSCLRG